MFQVVIIYKYILSVIYMTKMTLVGAHLAIKILVGTLNASLVMKTANNGTNSSMNSCMYGKTFVR